MLIRYVDPVSLQCYRSTSGDKWITGSYNIDWRKAVRCCNVMGTVEKFVFGASGENSSYNVYAQIMTLK